MILLKKTLPGIKKLSPTRKINEQYHFQTPIPLFSRVSQAGFVSLRDAQLKHGVATRELG